MNAMQWAKKQSGFTIVELLIVVVVIAILAAITIVAYNGIQNRAKESVLKSDIAQAIRKLEIAKSQSASQQYPSVANADLRSSTGTTLTYSPNVTTNAYCISVANGQYNYVATSADTTVRSGDCLLRDNLVVWVPMNGNANNNGSYGGSFTVNGATLTNGQNGQPSGAYQFTADTNLIQIVPGDFPVLTASAWVNPSTYSGTIGLMNGVGSSSPSHWEIVSGSWRLRLAGLDQPSISSPAPVQTWSHVAFSYVRSTGTLNYYLNGERVRTLTADSGINNYFVNGLIIGQSNGSPRQWLGSIDDVRIYSRALSDGEIMTLYNAGAQ